MKILELPFNVALGLTPFASADGELVSLKPDARHLNHLGTVHAGAIFAVAEAAAAKLLQDQFSDLAEGAILVLRGTTTKYRNPALPEVQLLGMGTIADDDAIEFRERLTGRGRALADVRAQVLAGDEEVFRGTFTFFVTRPTEASSHPVTAT